MTTSITRPCPHCGHDYDISTRIHGDRVWCRFCGKWFAVVMRLDGSMYLSPCAAPDGTQPATKTTADAELIAEMSAMRAELLAAKEDNAILLAACEAVLYFKENGYSKQTVWRFAKHDQEHPAWFAYLIGGTPSVDRWVKDSLRTAIAKTRGESQ